MQHADLIKSLGDTGAVASALGQRDTTVSMWKQRGVPWRWRPSVAALAKAQRVPLPADFLEPNPEQARNAA